MGWRFGVRLVMGDNDGGGDPGVGNLYRCRILRLKVRKGGPMVLQWPW